MSLLLCRTCVCCPIVAGTRMSLVGAYRKSWIASPHVSIYSRTDVGLQPFLILFKAQQWMYNLFSKYIIKGVPWVCHVCVIAMCMFEKVVSKPVKKVRLCKGNIHCYILSTCKKKKSTFTHLLVILDKLVHQFLCVLHELCLGISMGSYFQSLVLAKALETDTCSFPARLFAAHTKYT